MFCDEHNEMRGNHKCVHLINHKSLYVKLPITQVPSHVIQQRAADVTPIFKIACCYIIYLREIGRSIILNTYTPVHIAAG